MITQVTLSLLPGADGFSTHPKGRAPPSPGQFFSDLSLDEEQSNLSPFYRMLMPVRVYQGPTNDDAFRGEMIKLLEGVMRIFYYRHDLNVVWSILVYGCKFYIVRSDQGASIATKPLDHSSIAKFLHWFGNATSQELGYESRYRWDGKDLQIDLGTTEHEQWWTLKAWISKSPAVCERNTKIGVFNRGTQECIVKDAWTRVSVISTESRCLAQATRRGVCGLPWLTKVFTTARTLAPSPELDEMSLLSPEHNVSVQFARMRESLKFQNRMDPPNQKRRNFIVTETQGKRLSHKDGEDSRAATKFVKLLRDCMLTHYDLWLRGRVLHCGTYLFPRYPCELTPTKRRCNARESSGAPRAREEDWRGRSLTRRFAHRPRLLLRA